MIASVNKIAVHGSRVYLSVRRDAPFMHPEMRFQDANLRFESSPMGDKSFPYRGKNKSARWRT